MNLLSTVFAETIVISPPAGGGQFATATIGEWVSWGITIIFILAGIIFLFMLLLGGIRWITSGGDKANTESARNQITAALIGLVIVFAAWAIATLIQNVFGVNLLGIEIPPLGG